MKAAADKLNRRKPPPVETPAFMRASLLSTSSVSSCSSVSTTNSIVFDRPISGQETPFTPPETSHGRGKSLSTVRYKEEQQHDVETLEEMLNDLKIQDETGNTELRKGSVDSPMAQKRPGVGWNMQQSRLGNSPRSPMRDDNESEDEVEYLPAPRSKKRPSSKKTPQQGGKAAPPAVPMVSLANYPSDSERLETQLASARSKGSLGLSPNFYSPTMQVPSMTKPQEERSSGRSYSSVNTAITPSPGRRSKSNASSLLFVDLSLELPFYESGPEIPAYASQTRALRASTAEIADSFTSKPPPERLSSTKSNINTITSGPKRRKEGQRIQAETGERMDPFRPYYDSNPYSSLEVKNEVLHTLKQKQRTSCSKKNATPPTNSSGYIYIFTWPDFPDYVKIGITKNRPKERVGQWGVKCRFTYELVEDTENMSFRVPRIVERLIQAELRNERRKFNCPKCRKRHKLDGSTLPKGMESTVGAPDEGGAVEHGEWYEISVERALVVVQRWRRWIVISQPYKDDATLREAWIWKHDVMNRTKTEHIDWARWYQWTKADECCYSLYHLDRYLKCWIPRVWNALPGWVISAFMVWVYFCFGGGKQGFAAALTVAVLFVILWRRYCS